MGILKRAGNLKLVQLEFFKYFVVGISGVLLDLLTLIILKEFLLKESSVQTWFSNATLSVAINQIIILIYNFALNKYWTFRNKEFPNWQLVKYLILFLINYLISILFMRMFSDQLGIDYRIVRITNIALSTTWNFLAYKFWVFK